MYANRAIDRPIVDSLLFGIDSNQKVSGIRTRELGRHFGQNQWSLNRLISIFHISKGFRFTQSNLPDDRTSIHLNLTLAMYIYALNKALQLKDSFH